MRSLVCCIIIINSLVFYGQVSDIDITNALMGSNVFQLEETLDSLNIWCHLNPRPNEDDYFVSIQNDNGTTKLFSFSYDRNGKILRIVIKYRHDNKRHLEELDQIKRTFDNINIGKFSTDVKIRYKDWKKITL